MRLSRSRFYFLLFLLLPALIFMLEPIILGDLSVWVALSRDTLLQKKLIKVDNYTFTANKDMVYPWLTCVIYGILYQLAGLKLVALVHKLIPSVWFFLWYRFARRQIPGRFQFWSTELIFVFLVGLLGSTLIFIERPALLATLLLIQAYILIQENDEKPISPVYFAQLMVLQILWVNIHGSFLLLPVMFFWSSGSQLLRRQIHQFGQRMLVGLALLVSCLLNPFGWKVFPYLLETAKISQARHLLEWTPPHQWTHPFATVYFYALSLAFVAFLIRHPRVRWKDIIFDPLLPLWISGFFLLRNTFILPLLLPAFLVPYLPLRPATQESSQSSQKISAMILNTGIVAALALMLVLFNPFLKLQMQRFLPDQFKPLYNQATTVPDEIVAILKTSQGRIFNDWDYGSDLALKQDNKYFIDTRNIIFSDEVASDYDKIIHPDEQTKDLLEKYKIDMILINGQKHPEALRWFASQPLFHQAASQNQAVLFTRASLEK